MFLFAHVAFSPPHDVFQVERVLHGDPTDLSEMYCKSRATSSAPEKETLGLAHTHTERERHRETHTRARARAHIHIESKSQARAHIHIESKSQMNSQSLN